MTLGTFRVPIADIWVGAPIDMSTAYIARLQTLADTIGRYGQQKILYVRKVGNHYEPTREEDYEIVMVIAHMEQSRPELYKRHFPGGVVCFGAD